VNAAFESKGSGGVYLGAGSSGIASEETAFSVVINPAKLIFARHSEIALYYRNFYLVKGLDQISMAGNFQIAEIPIGFSVDRFGNDLYSEYTISAAAAFEIIDSLAVGCKMDYYHLQIKNYNSASSYGVSLSAFYRVNKIFRTGFVYENITESTIGKSSEKLPVNLALAFSFNPIRSMELNFDIFKDNRFDFDYRAGLYYALNNWFKLMCGFRSLVNSYSAGMQIRKYRFDFVYAFSWHSELGVSNSLSVGYEF
jgi:hypothetical protein